MRKASSSTSLGKLAKPTNATKPAKSSKPTKASKPASAAKATKAAKSPKSTKSTKSTKLPKSTKSTKSPKATSSTSSTTYYLAHKKYLGKRVMGEKSLTYYLYKDGEWVKDTGSVISDLLNGYDSSEPAGSPYGFGNLDIMRNIESISAEEAQARIESGNYSEPDSLPTKPAQPLPEQVTEPTVKKPDTKRALDGFDDILWAVSNSPKLWAFLQNEGFNVDSFKSEEELMKTSYPVLLYIGSKKVIGRAAATQAWAMSQAKRKLSFDEFVEKCREVHGLQLA